MGFELILFAILPVAFYHLNRFRGTKGAGGAIVGGIVAVIAFAVTQDPLVAGAMGLAYFGGESIGWGRWLKMVPGQWSQEDYWNNHREPSRGKFIHNLANKVAKESKNYKKYARAALMIRGLIWWVPVGIASMGPGALAAVLGALMPYCYEMAWKKRKDHTYWEYGERYYGVLHGVMLAAFLAFR